MKNDLRKIEENCKQGVIDKVVQKNCKNVGEFLSARINLIDLLVICFFKFLNNTISFPFIIGMIKHTIWA